jgi:hypothetical protein
MTTDYTQDLEKHQKEIVEISKKYAEARKKSTAGEVDLDLLLTREILAIRGDRKSLSKENAILELMAGDKINGQNEEAIKLYKEWKNYEAEYKGYEKIQEALISSIMTIQSIMKYNTNNGG